MLCTILQTTNVPIIPPRPLGGCGNCWAAGYCAAYAPASTQVPANCPLGLPALPDGPAPPPLPVRGTVAPPPATKSRARRSARRGSAVPVRLVG